MSSLLYVNDLSLDFRVHSGWLGRKWIKAVNNISFELDKGQSLALVGESGSGKSSLAKILAGINKPSSGDIFINGEAMRYGDYSRRCRLIRMIFQDPNSSLNPRITVERILNAPLLLNTPLNADERKELIYKTLRLVGLLEEHATFYPQMLSNGQKQRVSLARALILNPRIIIIDESIAALDVSVRSQIINLLLDFQHQFSLSYVFVSNDLSLVRHISDKVLVMQQGNMVEYCSTETLFTAPKHELSKRLIMAYNNEFKK